MQGAVEPAFPAICDYVFLLSNKCAGEYQAVEGMKHSGC